MTTEPREKYLSAKELAAELRAIGITVGEDYVRAMLQAGAPHVKNGQRMWALPSEVLTWWKANPGFAPWAGEAKPGVDFA